MADVLSISRICISDLGLKTGISSDDGLNRAIISVYRRKSAEYRGCLQIFAAVTGLEYLA